MSDNAMARHGAFSWCELMTTDVQAATRFYAALLGWTTEEVPGMDYTVVHAGGARTRGMMAIPSHAAGTPPRWGTYVTVDDVDSTAPKAQELVTKTIVAVQEGTCDITPFPLSHCHVSSYHLNRLKGRISAVGRNRPFFAILRLTETIFGPFS